MICARCGTEYENEERICPRCFYGRPKKPIQLPPWLKWGGLGVLAAGLIAFGVWVYMIATFNSRWIMGDWDGGNLSIRFNLDDDTFMLINSDTVLEGTFELDTDTITLTTIDDVVYVYRYDKINDNKMKLTFNEGDDVYRVTMLKDEASIVVEESGDRSEELEQNQSGFMSEEDFDKEIAELEKNPPKEEDKELRK